MARVRDGSQPSYPDAPPPAGPPPPPPASATGAAVAGAAASAAAAAAKPAPSAGGDDDNLPEVDDETTVPELARGELNGRYAVGGRPLASCCSDDDERSGEPRRLESARKQLEATEKRLAEIKSTHRQSV